MKVEIPASFFVISSFFFLTNNEDSLTCLQIEKSEKETAMFYWPSTNMTTEYNPFIQSNLHIIFTGKHGSV